MINEFMASNGETIADEDGDFEDWIELYNAGEEAVTLEGWGLTDDLDDPFQWVFPEVTIEAGAFLLVWASGKDWAEVMDELHAGFRISRDGEWLQLTRPDGTVADRAEPVELPRDVSYGRQPDGGDEWFYFDEATPGAVNTSMAYGEVISVPVEFSRQGGIYAEPFLLELTSSISDAVIIYTLDGSVPDINNLGGTTYLYKNSYPQNPGDPFGPFLEQVYTSHLYDTPIGIRDRSDEPDKLTQMSSTHHFHPGYFPATPVRKGTVVCARLHREGAISAATTSHTYFVWPEGHPYDMPIVSLGIQEDRLFDYYDGVYNAGVDFDEWRSAHPNAASRSSSPKNFWRGGLYSEDAGRVWEYPATLMFYERDGRASINQGVGFRIHGGWGRNLPLKNMRLYARSSYDVQDTIHHDIFSGEFSSGGMKASAFRRLLLRSFGSNAEYLPDVVAHKIMQVVYNGSQRIRPAQKFINGEFWGITTVRDRVDQYHFANNFDIEPDNVVALKGVWGQGLIENVDVGGEGALALYREFYNYVIDHDMNEPPHSDWLANNLDFESYADFNIMRIYFSDPDWFGFKHAGLWRVREITGDGYSDGRWRTFSWDFDFSFRLDHLEKNLLETALHPLGEGWGSFNLFPHPDEPSPVAPEPGERTLLFRHLMENEAFKFLFINRFADHMNTVFVPERIERIVLEEHAKISPYLEEHQHRWGIDIAPVEKNSEYIEYARRRPDIQRQHIREQFGIEKDAMVTLDVNDAARGRIRVNTIEIKGDTPGISEEPYPWSGVYFQGVPVEVEALAEAGYRLVGWRVHGDGEEWGGEDGFYSRDVVMVLDPLADEVEIEAVFEPVPYAEWPVVLHAWDFDLGGPFAVPSYTLGEGWLSAWLGPQTQVLVNEAGQGFDSSHLRVNDPLGTELVLSLASGGFEHLVLEYETRRSGSGAGEQVVSYTLDGEVWVELERYVVFDALPQARRFDFAEVEGAADNDSFAVRITFEQGDGGTEGNNRFDSIRFAGVGLPGVNLPPLVVGEVGRQSLVEGGDSLLIDLDEVLVDPNGGALPVAALSGREDVVSVAVDDGVLVVTPLLRGDDVVTLVADDGHHPPVSVSFEVLVYPSAYKLGEDEFSWGYWGADEPDGSFPGHLMFLQGEGDDSALDSPLVHAYGVPHDDYHSDDYATIGFPYNNTRRTRINGLGADGISFINTGRGRDLGGALLALDTREVTNAVVGWVAGTVVPNERVYALRLQYRVGWEGVFQDVLDGDGRPVEYVRHEQAGHAQSMPVVALPEDALGEEYVQLLWRYYRVAGWSGPRAELRLSDLVVASEMGGAEALRIESRLPSAWQSGRVLPPVVVRAVNDRAH